MRIAFLSALDPTNINNWSGTLYYIFQSLQKEHSIDWVGKDVVDYVKHYHLIHHNSNSFIPEYYAKIFGRILSNMFIKVSNYDLIIARDYYFISNLKVPIPIVYIGDTTFTLFKKYLGVTNTYFSQLADNIEKKAISNADLIIYSSEWAKNSAINHYRANPNKIKVIEFGANLPSEIIPKQISTQKTDCCNLLFIGKDWQNKGGEKVYKTYLSLKKLGILCSLTIIGCTPIDVDILDPQLDIIPFINKSKIEDQKQLDKIFRKSHFFILPTIFDCYGIVLCEASAYGIPALAANVGGVHQVIKNGKNGYLLPPETSPQQYAQLIQELWKQPKEYRLLRISSRQEFEERLNWSVWSNKMTDVLEQIITQKQNIMDNSEKQESFYIPTYIINLKERTERKRHIIKEFKGKEEFNITLIDACTHQVGAIGLWNSIIKIIKLAEKNNDDVILICEDDHYFTKNYNKEYLIENILQAHEQGADILSGGIGGFGYAVPVAPNRYWVNWLWCTQFIIVYKKFFKKILNYNFKENDTADGVISKLSNNLMTLYPFISKQKEFGYSDITQGNKDNPNLITQHFERSDAYLSSIHRIATFYNYPYYLRNKHKI